jgi:Immunity protein 50
VLQISNSEALESRFGAWPSFHDAEVLGVRLDSGDRSDGRPRLELDIHVFAVEGQRPDGGFNFVDHTIATLEFTGIDDIRLDGFGPQNVLDDLVLHDLGPRALTAAAIQVELSSNNGLGGAFRCEEMTVLAAEPYVPGVHSVYSRTV